MLSIYARSRAIRAITDFETPDLVVKFQGEDVDLILSNRAELLLALEHVTQEALRMHSDDHSRIAFDANDYRALRIEELRMTAQAAAEKVKSSGQPFRFNPMNSRERRIIHIALRNETELRSESSGSGPISRSDCLSRRHAVASGSASAADAPIAFWTARRNRRGDRDRESRWPWRSWPWRSRSRGGPPPLTREADVCNSTTP